MDREQESYVHSRRAVESTIEGLISLLDALDEDPDLEPNGDEEPDSDGEPSLGRPDGVVNQTVSPGGMDDWELDRADSEPSLGWPENAGAGFRRDRERVWLATQDGELEDGHDAEAVNEDGSDTGDNDNGIGDADGRDEQWSGFLVGALVI